MKPLQRKLNQINNNITRNEEKIIVNKIKIDEIKKKIRGKNRKNIK